MKFDKVIEEAEQNNKLNVLKSFMTKEKQFQELFKDLEELHRYLFKVHETVKNNKQAVRDYINEYSHLGNGNPEELPPEQKQAFDNLINMELLPDVLEDFSQIFAKLLNQ